MINETHLAKRLSVLTYVLFFAVMSLLAGCASPEEKALGHVWRPRSPGGVTVYLSDINRKYRVVRRVSEKRR